MSDRVAVVLLDALDKTNISMLNIESLSDRLYEQGQVFCCSTRPHTAESNPMIWGGVENNDRYWVAPDSADVEGIHGGTAEDAGFVDPAMYFDRTEGEPVAGASGFTRADYVGESFIWDDLTAAGYDARALQVPIVLPPYSTPNVTDELDECWFPDTKERMYQHIRQKPALVREQFEDGADFLATSIQMPDKWLHGVSENEHSIEWVEMDEGPELDAQIDDLITYFEEEDISWVIAGDHGSPCPGAMKVEDVRGYEYTLPTHRKQSVIISSTDLSPPGYTHQFYEWLRGLYDVEPLGESAFEVDADLTSSEASDVDTRLEALGYK